MFLVRIFAWLKHLNRESEAGIPLVPKKYAVSIRLAHGDSKKQKEAFYNFCAFCVSKSRLSKALR